MTTEFSGDQLDQALLAHVLDRVADAGTLDPAGTAAVGSLSPLREECRRAKETLSEDAVADVRVEVPGYSSVVRITRSEFDALMDTRLAGVFVELDDALLRNRITWADVTAVAIVGGGARIPLIAQRLSGHTQVALVTTPQPALDAAVGAAIFAAYAADCRSRDRRGPSALMPPDLEDVAPGSATFRALAWSQADDPDDDPLLYTDETPRTVTTPERREPLSSTCRRRGPSSSTSRGRGNGCRSCSSGSLRWWRCSPSAVSPSS